MVEEAWHQSLINLPDDLGMQAFGALMRSTIIGDVEPGHVIEKAAEISESNLRLESETNPWISNARKYKGTISYSYPSPEFKQWLKVERTRLYKSVDSNGNIFLIQNPDAWEWKFEDEDQTKITFIRPVPLPTGDKIEKKVSYVSKGASR